MPTLPTYALEGDAPMVTPLPRVIVPVDPIGEGIKDLGEGIARMGAGIASAFKASARGNREADKLDKFNADSAVLNFKYQEQKEYDNFWKTVTPDNLNGASERYTAAYTQRAQTFIANTPALNNLPDEDKLHYDQYFLTTRNSLYEQSLDHENRTAKNFAAGETEALLTTNVLPAAHEAGSGADEAKLSEVEGDADFIYESRRDLSEMDKAALKKDARARVQTAFAEGLPAEEKAKIGVVGGRPIAPSYWTPQQVRGAQGVDADLMRVVKRASEISGVDFVIGDKGGVRDQATQDELVRQGFSKTRHSRHLSGRAIDLIPIENGKANPNASGETYDAIAVAMRQAAAELGVTFGKSLSWDRPHWELARTRLPGKGAAKPVAVADASGWTGRLDALPLKERVRLQEEGQREVTAQIKLADVEEAKIEKEGRADLVKYGYDLMFSDKLTPEWVDENADNLTVTQYRAFRRAVSDKGADDKKGVSVDPQTYLGLLEEVVRDPEAAMEHIEKAYADYKIPRALFDKLYTKATKNLAGEMKAPAGEVREAPLKDIKDQPAAGRKKQPAWLPQIRAYVNHATEPARDASADELAQHLDTMLAFDDWYEEHPDATDVDTRNFADDIIKNRKFYVANRRRQTIPMPRFSTVPNQWLINEESLAMTEAYTVYALKNNVITAEEARTEALLLKQWKQIVHDYGKVPMR